ncbi:SDR family NAD(P)-dependent oxidoreductase, partial [Bartonella sp. CL32QHWL-2]
QKKGARATLVPLNLHHMENIDTLSVSIAKRWQKLDIMVANAAILGTLSPIAHTDNTVFEDVFQINLISQWRLMKAVEPLLRQSDAGRAILLSSSVAHVARAFWGPYAASKAALEVLARCWAEELKQTPIKINCVDPGATRTAMRAQAMPGEDPQTLPSPQEVAAKI